MPVSYTKLKEENIMEEVTVAISLKDLKLVMSAIESKDYYHRQLSEIKKILNSGKNPEMMNAEILKMLEFIA